MMRFKIHVSSVSELITFNQDLTLSFPQRIGGNQNAFIS